MLQYLVALYFKGEVYAVDQVGAERNQQAKHNLWTTIDSKSNSNSDSDSKNSNNKNSKNSGWVRAATAATNGDT